jgi:lipopolysaccharide/colanic/teichoic acid biosynthesis glycosyltransferase
MSRKRFVAIAIGVMLVGLTFAEGDAWAAAPNGARAAVAVAGVVLIGLALYIVYLVADARRRTPVWVGVEQLRTHRDGHTLSERHAASATLVPEVAVPCGPVVESLSRVDAAIRTRRRASALAQRGFDTAFSIVALALSAPIVVLSMIAIWLESPGAVIFRQRRMGLHGRPFEILKLRGMYVDARQRHPELYDYASVPRGDDAPYFFHTKHDPRVTRVGRMLRRYSVDELPNFWNVLRGDMSVVGPRPEIPELAGLYGEALPRLLSVRPGVTSPAKALGRDALSFEETLALELHYVETRSFLGDLITIARTAQSVLRGTDAY